MIKLQEVSRGYSIENLKLMRRFYVVYSENVIGQSPIIQFSPNMEVLKLLEVLIYQLAERYHPEITLHLTVPGISSPLTAIRILAEIGTDMSVFATAKKL